jgi:2-keto-4-pentenoate hydratase/2-oxohepta-3-ene-1,7-dioic acid hydratase in catechol pathway
VKIYRFEKNGTVSWGREEGEWLHPLRASSVADLREATPEGGPLRLANVRLLAPVVPGKIVGIGRNYADHAKELGNDAPAEPLVFLKAPSTLLDPDATIELTPLSERVDFEGELAIVIGRTARRVDAADWLDYVAGFTCANDVTARDLQKKDVQFARAKSFDTFCPLGPALVTSLDVGDLALTTRVDGQVRQSARTSLMIFPPPILVEYVTAFMTLEPGDVILTGTPAGVGPLAAGETVEVEIEGIGILRNRVGAGE